MNAPREQTFAMRRDVRGGVVRTTAAEIRAAMQAVRGNGFNGDERRERIYCALWWGLTLMNAMSDEEV